MSRPLLPSLFIGGHEFSLAELSAARLDGELVGVGHAFAAIGECVDHRHRAASLAADVPPGSTVVGRSAAWLYGGSGPAPRRLELGVAGPATRWATPFRSIRSMRIRPEHRERLGIAGASVAALSPVSTVIDLARISGRPGDERLVSAVMARLALSADDVFAVLDDWTHLPGKQAIAERLENALGLSRR